MPPHPLPFSQDNRVSFISDGALSLALSGAAEGLEGTEADDEDLTPAEARAAAASR